MGQPQKLSNDDRKLLRDQPMFAEVSDEMFDGILKSSRALGLDKNEVVFHAGERADSFYVISQGVVRLFRPDVDGKEATVNLFRSGQSFGEAAMFLERAFPVTAQAIEPSRVLRINAQHIFDGIREEPRLAFGLLASMSVHLKLLVEEITLLRTPTAQLRLAAFLLRQAPGASGPVRIRLPYSKLNIAKRLGVSPEVLSRAFANLKCRGVKVERGTVEIEDISQLREMFTD